MSIGKDDDIVYTRLKVNVDRIGGWREAFQNIELPSIDEMDEVVQRSKRDAQKC